MRVRDQTDIEMFNLLEPVADGFRNYRARVDVSTTESLLIDKAQQLTPDRAGTDGANRRSARTGCKLRWQQEWRVYQPRGRAEQRLLSLICWI